MKYRYGTDENNQLLLRPVASGLPLVVDGNFGVDKENNLIYLLNSPSPWKREYRLPAKIVFKGSWHLTPNYDLEMALDENRGQFGRDTLLLRGEIISTDRDTLAFEIKSYDRRGLAHIQILKLAVTWLTDETNRIIFIVKKRPPDILTLESGWQLNQNQQIAYKYEKADLKSKSKTTNFLTFNGFWQISSANKLTYILSHSSQSRFEFRCQIETPTIYPQKGMIKYRLGMGLRQEARGEKIVCLYGEWKFSRKLGLFFQMDYGEGRIQEIKFGSDIYFDKSNKVTFVLKDKSGQPIGISVMFTHRFLKNLDAEYFLRLQSAQKEPRVDAGLKLTF
jgi:hypothetical protein